MCIVYTTCLILDIFDVLHIIYVYIICCPLKRLIGSLYIYICIQILLIFFLSCWFSLLSSCFFCVASSFSLAASFVLLLPFLFLLLLRCFFLLSSSSSGPAKPLQASQKPPQSPPQASPESSPSLPKASQISSDHHFIQVKLKVTF